MRDEGDREAADAVRALSKPTVAAWAANQLARRHGDEVEALLQAGEELRAAHERLLAGEGGEDVGQAAAAEREAVAALVERAKRLEGVSDAALERVAETLHAAAGSEQVRDELRLGVLTSEHQAAMFGGLATAAPERPQRRRGAGKPSGKAKGRAGGKTDPKRAERDRREEREERERAERERAQEHERQARLKAARAELRKLKGAHGRTTRALDAAERRLTRAREELAEREQEAEGAREEEHAARRALAGAEEEVERLEG